MSCEISSLVEITDASAGGKAYGLARLVAMGLPVKLGVDAMLASRKSIFNQRKGFEILKDEALTVGKQSGRLFEFRMDAPGPAGRKVMATEVLWMHDKSSYIMNFFADETAHPKLLEQFQKVLATFEQLE